MSKKSKITIVFLIIFLFGVIYYLNTIFSHNYNISILNNTNQTISNMEIKFKASGTIQKISKIDPKDSFKYSIDTNVVQGEDAIILEYKDIKNNLHEEYLVGYLEKGYSGNVKVIINSINNIGILDISIN